MKTKTQKNNINWQTKKLGEVCDILDSKRKPITKRNRVSGKYPYYGATGILDYVADYIFDEKLILIGEDGAKWESGENTAFIADGKYWVNNHAHAIRPHRDIILDNWIVFFFYFNDITKYTTGLTVSKLNQTNLKQIQIPLPLLSEQKRIVKILDEVFKVFNQNKDERIVRAISWLGKGYLEQKHVDKFIAFWTGLESINELLGDLFNIPSDERKLKCEECGKLLYPITAGVKKLFIDEMKIEKKKFKNIRNVRGKLLHGGGPLDDKFFDEIKKYNPIVRRVLIVGIGKLLKMKEGDIDKIIQQKSRLYNETLRFIIKAKLLNFNPPKLNEISKQPKIDLVDKNLLNRIIDNQGRASLKSKMMLKSNANFNNITYKIRGEDNTCVTGIKISEIKKVN